MSLYLILLFLFLLSSGLFSFNGRKLNNSFILLNFSILILLSITRFDVGWDYPTYFKYVYPYLSNDVARIEPLSQLIITTSSYSGSPQIQFILFGLITYILILITIWKNSEDKGLSFLVYFSFFYLSSLGVIRQAVAVSIIFYTYHYIIEKKLAKFIILVVIATLFHYSAILGLIIYPLFNWFRTKQLFIVVLISFFLIGTVLKLALNSTFLISYNYYLEVSTKLEGGSLIRIFYLIFNIILIILAYKKNDEISLKFCIIILIGTILPFILGSHIGSRLLEYFSIFYCIIIPRIICKYNFKLKYIICGILSFYFILNIYISEQNKEKSPYTPYQNYYFINKDSPRFKR